MTTEEIAAILKERFGEGVVGVGFQTAHPHVVVSADAWRDVAFFLRDDERLRFNLLRCISALDGIKSQQLAAVYELCRCAGEVGSAALWRKPHELCVKIVVSRDRPHVPSVADVWPAADWHEREAYDLMGLVFDGHPDCVEDAEGTHPRRILCPDDWAGHPLRKDYVFPKEYHGIPAVTQDSASQKAH